MYFEKLTEQDKALIENYIWYYARPNTNKKMAPLETILKHWDAAKSGYLSTLFKDQLIITKPIEFKEGESETYDKVDSLIYSDDRCDRFMSEIKEIYRDYSRSPWDDPNQNIWCMICYLFDVTTLAKNQISSFCDVVLPIKDTNYKVQLGAKPMRIIAKIANAYGVGVTPREDGISDLEYFRRVHSQVLNNKVLSGNLCLSIHPLDYMTMSDNNCGWDSCMSWMNDGEYKQGTVEMMNSPCVIVAYLTSSDTFDFGYGDKAGEWNNKKWRSLFIVDKDFIINIKGYPYDNSNLVKAAIVELTKLAGWGVVEPIEYEYYEKYDEYRKAHKPFVVNGRDVAIDFTAQAMYNDFGRGHYIALNPNETGNIINFCYNYSGLSECVWCGNTDSDEVGTSNGEAYLCCSGCEAHWWCDECGDRFYENENEYYITGEGLKVCRYCWEEATERDITNEEIYLRGNMYNVKLNSTNGKYENHNYDYEFYVYPDNVGSAEWKELFKADKLRKAPGYYDWETIYYLLPQDCTEEALREIGLSEDEVKEYLELEQTN